MRLSIVIGIAASALLAAQPAFAATFMNGNFELPGGSVRNVIPDGGPAATGIPGWSHSGGSFDIYEADNQGDGLAAQSGTHYVSFGHSGTVGGTLFQDFDTVAGTTYTITYYVAQQQGADATQVLRAILDNGSQTLTADNSPLPSVFTLGQALSFTAQGTTARISFFDATAPGAGGGANLALDSVSVAADGVDPVPEPATWAMLVAGFGLVGGMVRRGRRRLALAH